MLQCLAHPVHANCPGRDALVIMHTGGGKSMCYTIPALLSDRLVLVVSPLIALMQDQVANLQAKGIAAEFLASSHSKAATLGIHEALRKEKLRLLYVTPELLATDSFQKTLAGLHERKCISLLAIDEAHCISSWGHDFRPSYRRLGQLRYLLKGVPLLACTATASVQVQADIEAQLRLRNPVRLVSSFNRPNISYSVMYPDLADAASVDAAQVGGGMVNEVEPEDVDSVSGSCFTELRRLMLEHISEAKAAGSPPCAIIYCLKRGTTSAISSALSQAGVRCSSYHAKLSPTLREQVLAQWQGGVVPVVAATIAFGMGVDKAGVRLVVHWNLPKTLEGFYQESGRAGRDGAPARSVLFYRGRDRSRMDFLVKKDAQQQQKAAAKRLAAASAASKLKKGAITTAAAESNAGSGAQAAAVAAAESADAFGHSGPHHAFARVVAYCTGSSCRRAMLLKHFGEELPAGGCAQGCDACINPMALAATLAAQAAHELEQAQQRTFGGASKTISKKRKYPDGERVAGPASTIDAEDGEEDSDSDGSSDGEDRACDLVDGGRDSRKLMDQALAASKGEIDETYFKVFMQHENEEETKKSRGDAPSAAAGDLLSRLGMSRARPTDGHPPSAAAKAGSLPAAPTAGVDAAQREKVRSFLASAMSANPHFAHLGAPLVAAAAWAVELALFTAGMTRGAHNDAARAARARCSRATSIFALPEVRQHSSDLQPHQRNGGIGKEVTNKQHSQVPEQEVDTREEGRGKVSELHCLPHEQRQLLLLKYLLPAEVAAIQQAVGSLCSPVPPSPSLGSGATAAVGQSHAATAISKPPASDSKRPRPTHATATAKGAHSTKPPVTAKAAPTSRKAVSGACTTASTGKGSAAVAVVTARLLCLCELPITISLIHEHRLGHKLKELQKHAPPSIAAAAAEVVVVWKQAVDPKKPA